MTTLRTLIWFVVAAVAMLGAVWLAERPGTLTAEWQGWRLDTSVGALLVTIVVLILVGIVLDYPVNASFVAGTGFVLTSTAIVMQMLEERGQMGTPAGRRTVSPCVTSIRSTPNTDCRSPLGKNCRCLLPIFSALGFPEGWDERRHIVSCPSLPLSAGPGRPDP